MPRVEQNGMPTSLHYALTDSQCSKCGYVFIHLPRNFLDIAVRSMACFDSFIP